MENVRKISGYRRDGIKIKKLLPSEGAKKIVFFFNQLWLAQIYYFHYFFVKFF